MHCVPALVRVRDCVRLDVIYVGSPVHLHDHAIIRSVRSSVDRAVLMGALVIAFWIDDFALNGWSHRKILLLQYTSEQRVLGNLTLHQQYHRCA
eukprot:m.255334 g.255334  ORF g.255334 m.255334 type:complete len:94 (+) comp15498_c0_seq1:121-402(+)